MSINGDTFWGAFAAADPAFFGAYACTVTATDGGVYSVNGYVERGKGPRALPSGQIVDADNIITLIQSNDSAMPEPKRGWRVVANGRTYKLDALISSDDATYIYSAVEQ